ncbi:isocitrate lyase/phosphoenolpyruvate mutase family protein [Streptomyces flavochromogenes]|uniref:Isocitrate lyase/phosphoenolpyruvate mutase family protein n=1 Tax=Streptomyces flavochromogenes TaxID=68199 RepID=A0ABW6Y029_9ACTN
MTTQTTQTAPAALPDKARLFRSLHVPGRPVVLPNAWDVASARVVADAGAPAVATTSAGVAWSLGRGDGGHLGRRTRCPGPWPTRRPGRTGSSSSARWTPGRSSAWSPGRRRCP